MNIDTLIDEKTESKDNYRINRCRAKPADYSTDDPVYRTVVWIKKIVAGNTALISAFFTFPKAFNVFLCFSLYIFVILCFLIFVCI